MLKKIISFKSVKLFISLSLTGGLSAITLSNISFASPTANSPEVQQFINYAAASYDFSPSYLHSVFNQAFYYFNANHNDMVTTGSSYPYSSRPASNLLQDSVWQNYQQARVTSRRVEDGVAFWRSHNGTLQQVAAYYGIPPSVVVAILGMESNYGRDIGHYSAVQALSRLAFSKNSRSHFFKQELLDFLLLCREEHFNPLGVQASFDGGLGQTQFMPSTYHAYAARYLPYRQIDLLHNSNDAIQGIANYLWTNGWSPGSPIVMEATGSANHLHSSSLNSAMGSVLARSNSGQYWLGLHNFYVIKRYNHSTYYAMAVYQLSQQIQREYQRECANGCPLQDSPDPNILQEQSRIMTQQLSQVSENAGRADMSELENLAKEQDI